MNDHIVILGGYSYSQGHLEASSYVLPTNNGLPIRGSKWQEWNGLPERRYGVVSAIT
jgi:hypothetical protein